MKLLHTADWHVGKTLRGRSRADEHRAVLAEIAQIAREHEVDFALVAGDLFDTPAPTPESERVVYRALLDLRETGAQVIILSGNHDNPNRLEAVKPLLDIGGIHTSHQVCPADAGGVLNLEAKDGTPLRVSLMPFLSKRGIIRATDLMALDADKHGQEYADRAERIIEALTLETNPNAVNLMTAHGMVHGGVLGGGERSAHVIFEYSIPGTAFPSKLHYVALGHLHRAQQIPGACPIWYSGSPLQLDFGETENPSSVNVIEAWPGKPAEIVQVPLKSGRRLRKIKGSLASLEALVDDVGDAYLFVELTDPGRVGLADEVRQLLPNTVDVRIQTRESERPAPGEARIGREPQELFAEYLESRNIQDPAVVALFKELLDEAHAHD